MAGVEFVVQLLDKVSAPSKKVTASLSSIEDAAKGIDGLDPLASLKKGAPGGGGDLFGKPNFAPVIGGLTAIASAAAVAATAVAAIGAAAAVAFGKATLQAAIFRETSIKSLDVAFGSGQGAGKFEEAKNLALQYGESLDTVVGALREFKTAGFNDATGLNLFKGLQDLRVASPTANIPNLILAIKQIQAAGKLQGDELNQLGEAGLGKNLVFDALSKKLNKTIPELQKMQEAGQLTSDLVIPAILESIKSLSGGKELGALAQDAAKNTLGGALRGLGNLPGIVFDTIAKNVDTKSLTGLVGDLTSFLTGPEATAALAKAGEVFGAFVSAGAAIIGSLGTALGGIFSQLAPTGASFADALIAGAGALKDAAPAIGQFVTAVSGPIVAGFQSMADSFASLSPEAKADGFAAIQMAIQGISFAIIGVANLIGTWVANFGSAVAVLIEIQTIINSIVKAVGDLVSSISSLQLPAGLGQVDLAPVRDAGAALVGGVGGGATNNNNTSVSVNAAGFGADELAARVAAEVQNALRTLVPQVV